MNDQRTLKRIRALERRISYASPSECAALTGRLVKLKTDFACGKK